jgi:hypothetical protein
MMSIETDNAAWLAEAGDVHTDTDQQVLIPGMFVATYREGTIVRWTFAPSGSDAGYMGPSAVLVTGPEGAAELALEDVDGPFWRACQKVLGPVDGRIAVSWEE